MSKAPKARNNIHLTGIGVARGIAIGPVHVSESGALDVPTYRVPASGIDAEVIRFHDAVSRAQQQLKKLRSQAAKLPDGAAEELGYLLEAHGQMLEGSRLVRGVETRIREHQLNAEAAVSQEVAQIAHAFSQMDDPYLAERGARRARRRPAAAALPDADALPGARRPARGHRRDRRRVDPGRHRPARPARGRGLRDGLRRRRGPHRHHGALARPARRGRHRRPAAQRRAGRHHRGRRHDRRDRRQPGWRDAGAIRSAARRAAPPDAQARPAAERQRNDARRRPDRPAGQHRLARPRSTPRSTPAPRASACSAPSTCS